MKIKVLVVGPPKSGKTVLSNILSELPDAPDKEYRPTVGCRILEFEAQNTDEKIRNRIDIELWDCSGDIKYSTCWPAIAKDAQGVILVYDPAETENRELYPWFDYFVQQQGLRDKQCVIFENLKTSEKRRHGNTGGPMSNLSVIRMQRDDDAELTRRDFNNYFLNIFIEVSEKQDQEELNLLNV